jgi:hypothetical protein
MIFNLSALLRRFVTDFIDVFFRENARRAMARDPPLTVREAKERWTEMLDRRAAFHRKAGGKQEGGQGGSGWRDGNRHDGGRGRGGGRRGWRHQLPSQRQFNQDQRGKIQRRAGLLPFQQGRRMHEDRQGVRLRQWEWRGLRTRV